MKFSNIEKIPRSNYRVNHGWKDIIYNINRYITQYRLNLDPDFQREYV
jgi:hypothetical protein